VLSQLSIAILVKVTGKPAEIELAFAPTTILTGDPLLTVSVVVPETPSYVPVTVQVPDVAEV
jgi:hypothetical protein